MKKAFVKVGKILICGAVTATMCGCSAGLPFQGDKLSGVLGSGYGNRFFAELGGESDNAVLFRRLAYKIISLF